MKNTLRVLTLVILISMILGACGAATPTAIVTVSTPTETTNAPTATSVPSGDGGGEEPLYLSLVWHQHQPLYYKDDNGVYTRPWVRVHATKDYYDMAAMLQAYPKVHVTINLTPVLIRQLNDFVQNQAKDTYWVLSEIPASQLTPDQKDFILRRFFDANYEHIIGVFPGYQALLTKRGGATDEEIAAALESFTEQDFTDLQVWFNLAWIDPDELAKEPLKTLVGKGGGFTEADKTVLFEEIRRIMADVIPVHKSLQDSGQIEVITTPYAHPILPLIYDSNLAQVGNSSAELPEGRFFYPQDVSAHLEKAVEIYTENFGQAPRGLWPGEGSVAQEIVPFVANAGFNWMATGEYVLAESLDLGSFTRDSAETVQQADVLYRPYVVQSKPGSPVEGGPVNIIFRDMVLSDKVGFTYSGMPGEAAADDFMQRLENIRTRLAQEGKPGPHLVSVILDGENAWEYYDHDGKAFLNALYRKLSDSQTIQTITPSEFFARYPTESKIDDLFPGAWFSPNYDTWIGEPEETSAWNYLLRTRQALDGAIRSGKVSPEDLEIAKDYMYLAEGSDWFWWYGSDQDSGADDYFDLGYRSLLRKVYESLGLEVPDFVGVPITLARAAQPAMPMQGITTPVIDGVVNEDEWANAASYPAEGQSPSTGFYLTMDKTNLYVGMRFGNSFIPVQRVGFYLNSPRLTGQYQFTRTVGEEARLLLNTPANALVEWRDGEGMKLYRSDGSGWSVDEAIGQTVASGDTREFAIPLSGLGELEAGDVLRLAIVVQPANQFLPIEGPAQWIVPDISTATPILEVNDPAGDDHGPGTYTYPTNAVFLPDAFDIRTFTVAADEKNLLFKFDLNGPVPNPWGSGINLSIQTFDVYIDKDPGKGSGARLLLPGRNASLATGYGWEFALWAEGWTPGIYAPDAQTLEPKPVNNADLKIIVDPGAQSVTMRVPREVLGDGDPATWGYTAVVLGQEGYPATGVWRVRDVGVDAAEWRFGGGVSDSNHTRIIDLAWPGEAAVSQEDMLGKYPSSNASVGTLRAEDFPQLEMLRK